MKYVEKERILIEHARKIEYYEPDVSSDIFDKINYARMHYNTGNERRAHKILDRML